MIEFEALSKMFRVHQKEPGLLASFKGLVSRKWTEKHALNRVSAKVGAGEIVGLVGANGAGKTTLVKILSGIVEPSSGNALVLGSQPWKRTTDFKRQIALLMGQKAQLWWDLPAADCFSLLREIYDLDRLQFNQAKDELITALGVEKQLKTPIRRLSLGERMKMEIIASLLHRPKVVFLDEPTLGLDLTAQRAIRKFILEYREKHKPAMILTSHYMEDIAQLCKRLIVIRDGSFVFDGPLEGVLKSASPKKVLAVELDPDQTHEEFELPEALGKALPTTQAGTLRFEIDPRASRSAAQLIFQHLPVLDFKIEEEDIGSVIERLMHKREVVK